MPNSPLMSDLPAEPVLEGDVWMAERVRRRLDDARRRIYNVERHVGEREDAAGAQLLLRTLKLMVAQATRVVEETLYEVREKPAERESKVRTVRRVLVHLEQMLGPALEMLVAPPGLDFTCLIQPYIRLARAVTGDPGAELLFEAIEGFSYEVEADVFAEVREHVEIIAPGLSQTVADLPILGIVAYPARADSDTFLHAVVAHEVAHLALVLYQPEFSDSTDSPGASKSDQVGARSTTPQSPTGTAEEAQASTIPSDPTPESAGGAAAAAEPQEVLLELARNDVDRFLIETLQRSSYFKVLDGDVKKRTTRKMLAWFQELVCDILAVHMIGPAYLLGLTEFLLPTHSSLEPRLTPHRGGLDPEDGQENHPPPAWRLTRLREEVLGFFDEPWRPSKALDDAKAATLRYFALQDDPPSEMQVLPEPEGEPRVREVGASASEVETQERRVLDDAIDLLYPSVKEIVGEALFTRDTFQRDLPLIWSKLEQGIPPAERIEERRERGEPAESEAPRGPDDNERVPCTEWSQPIDWRSILNGGYLYFLHHSTQPAEDPASETKPAPELARKEAGGSAADESDERRRIAEKHARWRDRDYLSGITRGSIELSEILRHMIEMRNQFDTLNSPERPLS